MSDLVGRARAFAIAAHSAIGQVRKYTHEPYWKHSEAVATWVAEATGDEKAIAAAWLHDVIEDTQVTADLIFGEFGREVGRLVLEVTDISRPEDGNRKARKALDRAHLAKASPLGQTIKAADSIENANSIVKHDPDFARVYMREKRALLELLTDADPGLMKRAWDVVRRYERRHNG